MFKIHCRRQTAGFRHIIGIHGDFIYISDQDALVKFGAHMRSHHLVSGLHHIGQVPKLVELQRPLCHHLQVSAYIA